jgi:hypothetical protein
MKTKMLILMGCAALLALPAMAQGDGSLAPGPKPAIKTSKDAEPAMPVPGKTSFTADQARDHMIKRGYNLTSNPLKDDNGIWYAQGQKDSGKSVMVMMDYQGNVYEGSDYEGHPSSAPGVEPTNSPPVKPVSPQQH